MRLTYKHFRELAAHISVAWRGFFTEDELDEMAADDYHEYRHMLEDRGYVSEDLVALAERLKEDIDNGAHVALVVNVHDALEAIIKQNS